MTVTLGISLFAIAALATAAATARLLRHLESASMFDLPDERRVHTGPVPRGGGAAVAAVVLVLHALTIAHVQGHATLADGAWLACALAFALLGWWDDYRPRPARARLALQIAIAACFAIASVPTQGLAQPLVTAAVALGAVVFVVWTVNLFNFMDGADGFAATQALLFSAGAAAMLFHSGDFPGALIACSVAGAALGFLYWNRAPARVFMGDSGSYFFGFQLVAMTTAGVRGGHSVLPWLILMMPFLVDATMTLIRRVVAGDAWWTAHRTHAYQLLILGGWPANRLAWSLAALNVFLCWPLAALALMNEAASVPATLFATLVTGIIWVMINRGKRRVPADLH